MNTTEPTFRCHTAADVHKKERRTPRRSPPSMNTRTPCSLTGSADIGDLILTRRTAPVITNRRAQPTASNNSRAYIYGNCVRPKL